MRQAFALLCLVVLMAQGGCITYAPQSGQCLECKDYAQQVEDLQERLAVLEDNSPRQARTVNMSKSPIDRLRPSRN